MSPKLDPEGHRVASFTTTLVPQGTREGFFTGPSSGLWPCLVGKEVGVSVIISDTATVVICGRHHPTHYWIEVARFTATEVRVIPAMTELCASLTGNTGAVAVTLQP